MRLALAGLTAVVLLIAVNAFGAASSGTLEAAKQAKAKADAGVVAAESALTAAKATQTAAAKVVASIEAEAPEEKPKEEPPPTGAEVGKNPTGPPVPASGWHITYADAFGAPLSTDKTFVPIGGDGCFCGSSSSPAESSPANAKIGPNGLELQCTYTPEKTKKYTCSGGTTDPSYEFNYLTVGEWAVEIDAQWPTCHGNADPGFWVWTNTEELDFFEGWCFGGPKTWPESNGTVMNVKGTGPEVDHCLCKVVQALGFDPSLGYHRYTTLFQPKGSPNYKISEYVDGAFRWSEEGIIDSTTDGLIVSNGMRPGSEPGGAAIGTQCFCVRSIAMYQQGNLAGQGIKGGGIAPGTVVK